MSNFGPPWNQIKHIFEKGQVFQTLWQYKCNLATLWHGLIPNMAISRHFHKTI